MYTLVNQSNLFIFQVIATGSMLLLIITAAYCPEDVPSNNERNFGIYAQFDAVSAQNTKSGNPDLWFRDYYTLFIHHPRAVRKRGVSSGNNMVSQHTTIEMCVILIKLYPDDG